MVVLFTGAIAVPGMLLILKMAVRAVKDILKDIP